MIKKDHTLRKSEQPMLENSIGETIAFDLGESYLAIDKGTFTEDFIKVRQGESISELITDCSSGWIEGADWDDKYQRSLVWLEGNSRKRN